MAGVLEENTIERVAVDAINAGCDVLMFSYRMERAQDALTAVKKAVETGEIKKERIFESYQRIFNLKQKQKKRLDELGNAKNCYPKLNKKRACNRSGFGV